MSERPTFKVPSYIGFSGNVVLDVYEVLLLGEEDDLFWSYWVRKIAQIIEGKKYLRGGELETLMCFPKTKIIPFEGGGGDKEFCRTPAWHEWMVQEKAALMAGAEEPAPLRPEAKEDKLPF